MAGLIAGAVVQAIYLSTVAPGIAGGDAGELVAESCHLGTAHPPGYPLFTLLNHAFVKTLPGLLESVGLKPGAGLDGRASPAWCANATASTMGTLAAVFTAQTTGLLCGEGRRTSQATHPDVLNGVLVSLASWCAAMLMAFCPLFWQYSVTAEVFALNNFLLSLLCSLAMRFSSKRELRYAAFGAFVSGLALSNQHTAILYVVPLSAWVMAQLITSRCRFHSAQPLRRLAMETLTLASLFMLGLVPYAYLPLMAIYAPRPGSWGNLTTFQGLWHHLRRGDYGTLRLYSGYVKGGDQGIIKLLGSWLWDVSYVQGLGGVIPSFALLGILTSIYRHTFTGKFASGSAITAGKYRPSGLGPTILSSESQTRRKVLPCPISEISALQGTGQAGMALHGRRNFRETNLAEEDTTPPERADACQRTLIEVLASWDEKGLSAPTALLVALVLYLAVFHWLSNMPLDDPLLFGIHARFWMQPNILVFVFSGTGFFWAANLIRLAVISFNKLIDHCVNIVSRRRWKTYSLMATKSSYLQQISIGKFNPAWSFRFSPQFTLPKLLSRLDLHGGSLENIVVAVVACHTLTACLNVWFVCQTACTGYLFRICSDGALVERLDSRRRLLLR